MSHQVTVLGRDEVGVVAESDGLRYYLTECCGASATGTTGGTACRACYTLIDEALGGTPGCEFRDGKIVLTDLSLVESFGDGLPYETWKARRAS